MIDPVVLWSVIGILLLAGLVSMVIVWRMRHFRQLVRSAAAWRQADARVVSLRVEMLSRGESHGYRPIIEYEYKVGARAHLGSQTFVGPPRYHSFRRGAERMLSRYAVGDRVTVWVNPENLQEAVLRREAPFLKVLTICLVALWVAMLGGVAVLLFAPGVAGPGPALRL